MEGPLRKALLIMAGGGLTTALLFAFLKLLPQSSPQSPEGEVRGTLERIERAVERLEFARALKFISRDYGDPSGNTYRSLRRAALRAKREISFLRVSVIGGWDVRVEGGRATARGKVLYTLLTRSGEAERDVLDLLVHLRREQGRWLVYRVDGLPSVE